jgi:hypothetical protein
MTPHPAELPAATNVGRVYINRLKPGDDTLYTMSDDLWRAAREAESELRKSVQALEGRYLVYRQIPLVTFSSSAGDVQLEASDLLRFLEPLVRASTYDSAEERAHSRRGGSFASAAGRKVREFIEVYVYELRNLICKRAKANFPVSSQTTIAIAGLTHWLMEHFGVHAEYAKSLATGILVALLTATKGAFCKMNCA